MLRPPLLQILGGLTICDRHKEQEKFYCEKDQRPLCNSCLLAPEHKDHQVLPLETAAGKCKKKIMNTLTALRKKEEEIQMALSNLNIRKTRFEVDSYNMKESLISEYGKIHRFLWDRESQYLQKLESEVRENLAELNKNKTKLQQQTQTLQRMMVEIEENLDKVPLEMLQNMKGTLERKKEVLLQGPEVHSPSWSTFPITALIEVLETFQRDITLDPETANPRLILSEDLKRVRYGNVTQDLPDNEERFDTALVVLGAQTFTSGKHYWEVDVGGKTEWELGICKDSIKRKGKLYTSPQDIMTLTAYTSQNCFFLHNSVENFEFSEPIQKVGIFLDYEMGHIAFYDVADMSFIYSFPNTAFEGPLRPYFSPCSHSEERTPGSLIICSRNSH